MSDLHLAVLFPHDAAINSEHATHDVSNTYVDKLIKMNFNFEI